ncbi:MAG: hypothetical protein ACXVPL_04390 [Actinomycetota bacterium]
MAGVSLEAVVLYVADDGIRTVSSGGRETVHVAWDPDLDPHETVVDAVAAIPLTPLMVHSTSWRAVGSAIVVTFLVVVERPAAVPAGCTTDLVARVDLARGLAIGPPAAVRHSQVVEHGLRHLAWLLREDVAIRDALDGWRTVLADYEPEPFRAFGREPGS